MSEPRDFMGFLPSPEVWLLCTPRQFALSGRCLMPPYSVRELLWGAEVALFDRLLADGLFTRYAVRGQCKWRASWIDPREVFAELDKHPLPTPAPRERLASPIAQDKPLAPKPVVQDKPKPAKVSKVPKPKPEKKAKPAPAVLQVDKPAPRQEPPKTLTKKTGEAWLSNVVEPPRKDAHVPQSLGSLAHLGASAQILEELLK